MHKKEEQKQLKQKKIGKMMKFRFLVLFLVLSCGSIAQTRLEVRMPKTTLKVGEAIRLDFVFNAVGDDFIPPKIVGFQVNGPMMSQSENVINGAYSGSQQFSYVIQATRPGKFTIPSAMVEFRGKIFKSQPVVVNVLNQSVKGEGSSTVESPSNKSIVGKNAPVFIEAEVSKNTAYLNEPIEVSYRVYLNPKYKIEKENKINFPKYNNFWSQTEDLRNNNWEQINLNGRIFYTKLFRRTVLYPQKTGNLIIDPLSLDFNIAYPTGELDFFNDPEYETARRVIATPVKAITVKPLPEKGKPENFTGAVGTFEFEVIVDKFDSRTGEAIQMDFVVSGTGNLKLFEIPKPKLPSDFEVFEPIHKEEIQESIRGMSGKISDSYTIIPQNKGDFLVKPQQFSYFDIQTKSYKTISSDEINLTIAQGDKYISQLQKNNTKLPKTILPIFTEASFVALHSNSFFGTKLFYSLVGIPILAALVLFLRKKKTTDYSSKNTQKTTSKSVKKAIFSVQKLEDNLHDKDLFYNALEENLKAYLCEKFSINSVSFSKEVVVNTLKEAQLSDEIIQSVMDLLQSCEMAKYAPVSNINREQDLEKVKHCIQQIENS